MNNKQIAQKLREFAQELDPIKSLANEDYWTINIEKGMTIEGVLAECKKLFPIWRWTDDNLDQIINSDRTSKKSYSIKLKANVEADEELKNLSANQLQEKDIKGITLLERLVLELDYFKKTGGHLDIKNITLCSGSRYSDGRVPGVCWSGIGGLGVDWYGPDRARGGLRSREIIVS